MFTTSVQNHQQPLSGNSKLKKSSFFFALAVALGVSACTPKAGALRSPVYKGNVGGATKEVDKGAATEHNNAANTNAKNRKNLARNISLVLPFQLDQVTPKAISDKDVKRAALALDFYQGFQLGLEELAQKGGSYNLNVLDSRDNANYSASVALSSEVGESGLVVGPVYPSEIKAFGAALEDKNTLQINPLAATMPTEFNLPNLVSLTPPIVAHSNAIAAKVARTFISGDIIIVYQTADNDSKQFLTDMLATIKQHKNTVNIITVSTLAQLNEKLSVTGSNIIVSGTTDKTQLNALLTNLTKKYNESYYTIKLFGHPLWDRFDFSNYSNFSSFTPVISSESNVKNWTSAVKTFKQKYSDTFGITASDHAFKGYDAALYFGGLMNKYGVDKIKDKLTAEPYNGIFSNYKFTFNEKWGFSNEAVSFKEFRNGAFQLQ